MNIGYSAHGFTGDNKIEGGVEVSTPDGNSTYVWSILHELQLRNHKVFWMQKDRDFEAVTKYRKDNFAAFSQDKRWRAYNKTLFVTPDEKLPELDILILEWRFPIPGRNTKEDVGKPGFQQDLQRQAQLIEYYLINGTNTKIVILDLDHKLTKNDELYLKEFDRGGQVAILEPSSQPRKFVYHRRPFEFPTIVGDLLQFPTRPVDKRKKLVYVGSRYERDDVITKYLLGISNDYPGDVHFYGNWLKTVDECRNLWPHIEYHDRITTRDFREAYDDAVACPLLAKQSYLQTGFMTPRVWEAILFGTIPIGLREARGIDSYCAFTVSDGLEMTELVGELSDMSLTFRHIMREEAAHRVRFMDARYFVDQLEVL